VTTIVVPHADPAGSTSGRVGQLRGNCRYCHRPTAGPASRVVAIPKFAEDEPHRDVDGPHDALDAITPRT
jgi:hypothetical protein